MLRVLFCNALSPSAVSPEPLVTGLVLSPTDKLQSAGFDAKLAPEKLPVNTKLPNVPVPQTFKLPAIPTPPDTVSAPPVQLLLCVVLVMLTGPDAVTLFSCVLPVTTKLLKAPVPQTFKLPPIPAPPNGTASAPLVQFVLWVGLRITSGPVKLMPPVEVIEPHTFKLPRIPTPPATTNAPPVHEKLCVSLVIITGLAKVPVPHTFRLPAMPTPPLTVNAPFVQLVLCVELIMSTGPEIITSFKVVTPSTVKSPPISADPLTHRLLNAALQNNAPPVKGHDCRVISSFISS